MDSCTKDSNQDHHTSDSDQEPASKKQKCDDTQALEKNQQEQKKTNKDSYLHLLRRKRQRNSKKWHQMVKKAKSWLRGSEPVVPCFAIMYLKTERGRPPQIVWTGSPFMKPFCENEHVQKSFLNSASSSSQQTVCKPQSGENKEMVHPLISSPLQLVTKNPQELTTDTLYKITNRVLNPWRRKGGFYRDIRNKPTWFPETVVFKCPTHQKRGEKKYSFTEMCDIMREFITHCPEMYIICKASQDKDASDKEVKKDVLQTNPDQPSCSWPEDLEATVEPTLLQLSGDVVHSIPAQTQVNSQISAHKTIGTSSGLVPGQPLTMQCSAEMALTKVYHYRSEWMKFIAEVKRIEMRVDMSRINNLVPIGKGAVSTTLVNTSLQNSMTRVIPRGFTPLESTRDGNCLYSSASLALLGSSDASNLLRFSSVCCAVKNFTKYLNWYTAALKEPDSAQQFVCTMASTDAAFLNRPKSNPTVEDLVKYILQTEIITTAHDGAYSGLLQVQFLADSLCITIKQHIEEQFAGCGYDKAISPLIMDTTQGVKAPVMHLMWVKSSVKVGAPNHIVPLIPPVAPRPKKVFVEKDSCIFSCCGMEKMGQCVSDKVNSETLNWVLCDRCQSWYHSACIGMTPTEGQFFCCQEVTGSNNQLVISGGQRTQSYMLYISDVLSLYPGRGISDAVIDFYIRTMLPRSNKTCILSALTYQGIERVMSITGPNRNDALKEMHKAVNGGVPFWNNCLTLFPCNIRDAWHWILLVLSHKDGIVYVLDSLKPNSQEQAVRNINVFADAVCGRSTVLAPKTVKIAGQKNMFDCGIHVLYYITLLNKDPDIIQHVEEFEQEFDASKLRGSILFQIYEKQKLHRQTCSRRITEAAQLDQRRRNIDKKLFTYADEGIKAVNIPEKGRGVKATRLFRTGEFITEYSGELISYKQALEREKSYGSSSGKCYMFFFERNGKKLCVDATAESGRLGRLINHSKATRNASVKLYETTAGPKLIIVAAKDIQPDEEILFDYGDRSKSSVEAFPWLLT